ncbi:acyltransferase family protein [Streptococcus dentiloxodontae]
MKINWFSYIRVTGLFLVLFYHFFSGIFSGGFIGVDIFFTFSGYLITALLIDEVANRQRIDYKGFLWRRFYRIIPPLVIMVLLCMPLTFFVRNDFVAGIGRQIASVFGFMTNFYEILTGGSYESRFNQHLFIHTWSLAIEMQFYLLWGALLWFFAKKVKHQNQFRGLVFITSLSLFAISFLAMFIGAFLTDDFSTIYFSTVTHIFPFFLGALFATVTGISETTIRFKKNVRLWPLRKTVLYMAGSAAVLLLLGFVLDFEGRLTYLFGFALASLFAASMIYAARVLHEQLPERKEPRVIAYLADISYSVYLFHWPLYIIFSQLMGNFPAVLVTTVLSLLFATLSYYIIEPFVAGKKVELLGRDLVVYKNWIWGGLGLLAALALVISVTAPSVGDFEYDLQINSFTQAQTKMNLTRSNAENSTASDYNVSDGVTILGDSVALRATDQINATIESVNLDAAVSRNLSEVNTLLDTYISSKALSKYVVVAVGVNEVGDYKTEIDSIISKLPQGRHLIFVTPYNGEEANDSTSQTAQVRAYEEKMAKKYDYISIADWYQAAVDNPSIWAGTDGVHYGTDSDTVVKGAQLYADTIQTAVTRAANAPVKGAD